MICGMNLAESVASRRTNAACSRRVIHRRRARADRGADRESPLRCGPNELRSGGGAPYVEGEQVDRMRSMRRLVSDLDVYRWDCRMLVDAVRLRNRDPLTNRLAIR